ncbi:MAG: phage portal protein [Chloroflexi bacterium]|nr:phage portal protein [Chloroflexota bacterium]
MYKALPVGEYIDVGGRVIPLNKAEGASNWLENLRKGKLTAAVPTTQQELIAKVGWVYAALDKRRRTLLEVPTYWEVDGAIAEEFPFAFDWRMFAKATDIALQATGNAYWFKERNLLNFELIGFELCNPLTTIPLETSWTKKADGRWGFTQYQIQRRFGDIQIVPAEDIIHFKEVAWDQHKGDFIAGEAASLAAQILYGLNSTADTFYDLNGMQVLHVKVSPQSRYAADEGKLKELERRLAAIFNPTKANRGNRTIATDNQVEVTPIKMSLTDIVSDSLTDQEIDAILAAHDVPIGIGRSRAATNATAEGDKKNFVLSLASRLKDIAEVLERDPDIAKLKLKLVVKEREHLIFRADDKLTAEAFLTFVNGGFTPEAAAHTVGIRAKDYPDDMVLFTPKPAVSVAPAVPALPAPPVAAEEETADEAMGVAKEQETKALRKWRRKYPERELGEFVARFLTAEEVASVSL